MTEENAPWYHTNLSRSRAEEMLVQAEKNGAFIVRASESINGAYVLSEFYNNRVHHYRILPSDEGYFIECPGSTSLQYFEWLRDLVDFYGKPKRGLVCELTYAVELDDDDDDDDDAESSTLESNVKFFNALSNRIHQSNPDQELEKQFREYFSRHLLTDSRKFIFDEKPEMFYRLFENDISNVFSSIDILQKRLLYAHELLSLALGSNDESNSLSKISLISSQKDFLFTNSVLLNTTELISKTVSTADKVFKQLSAESLSQDIYKISKNDPSSIISDPNVDLGIDVFEVLSGIKLSKTTIQVNTSEGNFVIQRSSNKQKLLCVDLIQLIKNQNQPLCLTIVHKQGENINLSFQTLHLRERFCDVIMVMMNKHNFNLAKESISLFTGTWNMGEATLPDTIESWLIGKGTGMNLQGYERKKYDLYLIGVQENTLLLRIQSTDWPSKMRNIISSMNKIDYKIIAFEHFWHIGLVAIIKADLHKRVSNIQQTNVKTGLGKINVGTIVGNKGAVGISFCIDKTSFLFINCHLTSGHEQKRLEKRRANYRDIMKNLIFKSTFPHCDVTNQFNYVFFMGDLNYRLDLDFETILERISESDFDYLKQFDQLRTEICKNNAFYAFDEAPIRFAPTYRYARGSRTSYHIVKKKPGKNRINVPSYCDRILFKSYPNSPLLATSYGCTDDLFTSDHSPVYATFLLAIQTPLISKYSSSTANLNPSISIRFEEFEAFITRTNPHEMFYIQCFGNCFEGIRRSKQCSTVNEVNRKSNDVIAKWTPSELQELIISVNNDQDFLMQQSIFIQVKCSGGDDDTFGEALISLGEFLDISTQKFSKTLTYQTYPVGRITGKLIIGDPTQNYNNINESKLETFRRIDIVYSSGREHFSEDLDHSRSVIRQSNSNFSSSKSFKQTSNAHKVDLAHSLPIDETIDSLQNTDLISFLKKYNLGNYSEKLIKAGFRDTVQLYFLDEKYLDSMGITGDDGKKLYLLAQFISNFFTPVK